MRHIGAVIDYDAKKVHVPMLDNVTQFPITFRAHVRTTPGVANHVTQITHNTAFAVLPQIEGLLRVMVTYNPRSPWLPTARKLAKALSKSMVTPVPPSVRHQSNLTSVLRNSGVSNVVVPYVVQPSRAQVSVQGHGLSVTFGSDSNAISHEEDGTAESASNGQSTARWKIAGLLRQDMGGHAH